MKTDISTNVVSGKRIEYIDLFRAIGIILMIMGHVGFGDDFDFIIHAFHMPMFFIIAGYFFNADVPFDKFISKKFKTLIVPYFSFGIIHFIISTIITKNINWESLFHLFFVNTDGLPIAGALWFLTALFFAELFYFFICKVKHIYREILIVLISILGNVATVIFDFRLPYALDSAFTGVGLIYIGNLIKQYKNNKYLEKILNLNVLFTAILFAVSLVLITANSYVNMRAGTYGIIPLFWLNATLSSLTILLISKHLDKYLNKNITKYFSVIGKDSITYLCLNQIVIVFVLKILNVTTNILGIKSNLFVFKMVELISVIALLYLIDFVIQKTKLRVLLGKKL